MGDFLRHNTVPKDSRPDLLARRLRSPPSRNVVGPQANKTLALEKSKSPTEDPTAFIKMSVGYHQFFPFNISFYIRLFS